MSVDHGNLPVGTPVHVEFDGTVYDTGEGQPFPPNPNHFEVSDGHFIHHLHRHSANITVKPKPRPEMELGQVWRVEAGNYVVYSKPGNRGTVRDFLLCGPRLEDSARMTYDGDEFFAKFSDAELILEPNGYPVADY